MKIGQYCQGNSSYLSNDLSWKDVTYDNIKSHKEPGFHPLFRRHTIRKTTGGKLQKNKIRSTILFEILCF